MIFLQQKDNESVTVSVYIQPRASVTKIVGIHDDSLKLKITAPPVDGKANSQVILFFSKLLKIPRSSIEIISGAHSRRKVLLMRVLDINTVKNVLGCYT